jgi:hypothetical protein
VRHITCNPRVALNFNTDADGGDVGVLIGEALISQDSLPSKRIKAYTRKYQTGIKSLGMTPATPRQNTRSLFWSPRRQCGTLDIYATVNKIVVRPALLWRCNHLTHQENSA